MTRRRTIIFGFYGKVKSITSGACSRYTVTLSFGGRGIGEGVHENYAYCFLLRMANLLTFIHNGGISKVAAPILKMVLIFLVTKVFQKGTMFR